ncbi:MAG TPA: EAL domain-containing protein [Rugosibacter sp.]|nr:EAL domain-containing protein [Rugosibacter sp.]HQQ35170.1 EAL domain-containing protein [Rugosibacter sp.]
MLLKLPANMTASSPDEVYRTLFEQMASASCLLKDGFLEDCNPAALALLGYTNKEQLTGKSPEDLSPEIQPDGVRSSDKVRKLFELALQKGTLQFEWTHLRANGESILLEVSLTAFMLDGARMVHALWRDLSARNLTENALRKSQSRLRVLYESADDAIILFDNEGVIECNIAATTLFGCATIDDLKQATPSQVSPLKQPCGTDSAVLIKEHIQYAMQNSYQRFEWLHRRLDNGKTFTADVSLNALVLDGKLCLQSTIRDITDRKKSEEIEKFRSEILELLTQELLLPHTLEAIVLGVEKRLPGSLCGILLVDSEGKHLGHSVAPSLPDPFVEALTGLAIGENGTPCGRAAFFGEMIVVEDFSKNPIWLPYLPLLSKFNLVSCWSQPIFSSTGKVLGTFVIYFKEPATPSQQDISLLNHVGTLASIAIERAKMEEQVLRLAYYDELTNLPNRRLLLDRLNKALSANARSGKYSALLFIDLDNFKSINDTMGHSAGDVLLHFVALRLVSCVRHEDTVARLGGDEFVVMLESLKNNPTEALEQAEATSKKILNTLRAPYLLNNKEQRATPSIGAVVFSNKHELTADTLIKQADIAMYHAKQAGRNSVYFFNPQMEAKVSERVSLASDLHDALEKNQLSLVYQIQVNRTGLALGAEALLRWHHPTKGMVSPLQFIPIAEDTGLIVPVGLWVLNEACAQIRLWQKNEKTRHLVLAINVSARQFLQPDFVAQVELAVERHQINPRGLKIELTESVLIADVKEIVGKMNLLQTLGIHFALDDFGTGYSSLQYIKQLPLNQLKIDQSFIRDIETDSQDRSIVRTIIATAKSFNLEVIAEGVETIGQKNFLVDEGCYNFQGYFFSKPLPVEQFEQLLENEFIA